MYMYMHIVLCTCTHLKCMYFYRLISLSFLLEDVNDRDLSCVVSSLVQIMCDPHYRTITGFESLVQKEWVAMGHPFTSRSGLVATEDEDGEVLYGLGT